MTHSDQLIHIFFGNKLNAVLKSKLLHADAKSSLLISPLTKIKEEFNLKSCFFLQQVHGVDGLVVDEKYMKEKFLSQEGDFIITNCANIGIGVLTADCLPIIMVDTQRNAIGIAHAGWRGSVQKIGPIMLHALQKNFNANASDITVYCGPSALPCCYEVNQEFKENLEKDLAQKTIINRNGVLFFDLPLYNKLLLLNAGIPQENFISTYNQCTLCTPNYCSYRKEKDDDLRQVTLVSLK